MNRSLEVTGSIGVMFTDNCTKETYITSKTCSVDLVQCPLISGWVRFLCHLTAIRGPRCYHPSRTSTNYTNFSLCYCSLIPTGGGGIRPRDVWVERNFLPREHSIHTKNPLLCFALLVCLLTS